MVDWFQRSWSAAGRRSLEGEAKVTSVLSVHEDVVVQLPLSRRLSPPRRHDEASQGSPSVGLVVCKACWDWGSCWDKRTQKNKQQLKNCARWTSVLLASIPMDEFISTTVSAFKSVSDGGNSRLSWCCCCCCYRNEWRVEAMAIVTGDALTWIYKHQTLTGQLSINLWSVNGNLDYYRTVSSAQNKWIGLDSVQALRKSSYYG